MEGMTKAEKVVIVLFSISIVVGIQQLMHTREMMFAQRRHYRLAEEEKGA